MNNLMFFSCGCVYTTLYTQTHTHTHRLFHTSPSLEVLGNNSRGILVSQGGRQTQ